MLFPERGVHASWSFFLLVLLAAVISPVEIVVSVLLAAALHECGHLLALRAFRVPVEGLKLSALGAVLYARGARRLSYGRELIVTLAGCGMNLLCGLVTAGLRASRFVGGGLCPCGRAHPACRVQPAAHPGRSTAHGRCTSLRRCFRPRCGRRGRGGHGTCLCAGACGHGDLYCGGNGRGSAFPARRARAAFRDTAATEACETDEKSVE